MKTIVTKHPEWKPSDVAFIKSLNWSQGNVTIVFYCQPKKGTGGWPDRSDNFFEISMTFKFISGLKLNFASCNLQQISGFNIVDVSMNGLERINFEIEDFEHGIIEFVCESIEVNSVSDLFKINFNEL